ncbi:hypothetical protein NSE01_17770 [Novosphingobium sediminis]|uniref:Uncharacterized protein n=1 Tax=Novosphingobium sediminis TaxID=707214 RepID=A0A512AJS5_9SPHN|nr:hypothetical protein NSE01_17770 [Novosphingobium sediminis]
MVVEGYGAPRQAEVTRTGSKGSFRSLADIALLDHRALMRASIALWAVLIVAGCRNAQRPEIERVEMRRSGWSSIDVSINSAGVVNYRLSKPYPNGKTGTVHITHDQFTEFVDSLEVYRAKAEPYRDESAVRFVKAECPPKLWTTDQGAMYIRWFGPQYDAHFLMDFGCDVDRNAIRNRQMRQKFERLPLPHD